MDGVNPDTVWTWNAIGKRAGAWNLAPDAPEATRGFLLNHLISELLPEQRGRLSLLQHRSRSPGRPPGTTCACGSRKRRRRGRRSQATLGRAVRSPMRRTCPQRRGSRSGMTALPETPDEEARPRHRPRHLRRLPGLRDELQGMEHRRLFRAADRPASPTAPIRTASGSTACTAYEVGRGRRRAAPCISRARACTARRRPASRSARPAPPTSAPRTASCWSNPDICIGCKLCSWACPYGAREYDDDARRDEEMHAVRRPHLQRDARPEDRVPACVRACPTGARHFGDLGDPDSAVSQLVAERGGFDLMPELGYKPVNKYLPPRQRRDARGGGRRARRRRRRRRRGLRQAPRPSACSPGSTGCCPLIDAPCTPPLRHLLHHRLRRRLRPAGAGWRWPALLAAWSPRERWLGLAGFGLALALITAGLLSSTAHLGQAGARLARVLAVAHVLAVARGRAGGAHLRAGRAARLGWVLVGRAGGSRCGALLTALVRGRRRCSPPA